MVDIVFDVFVYLIEGFGEFDEFGVEIGWLYVLVEVFCGDVLIC